MTLSIKLSSYSSARYVHHADIDQSIHLAWPRKNLLYFDLYLDRNRSNLPESCLIFKSNQKSICVRYWQCGRRNCWPGMFTFLTLSLLVYHFMGHHQSLSVSAVQLVQNSFVKNVSGNIQFVAIQGSQHDQTECGLTSGKLVENGKIVPSQRKITKHFPLRLTENFR